MVNIYLEKYPPVKCLVQAIKNGILDEIDEESIMKIIQTFINSFSTDTRPPNEVKLFHQFSLLPSFKLITLQFSGYFL